MAQEKESKTNWHFRFSIIKSALRFTACYFLFKQDFAAAAIFLGGAEFIGVIEEF